MQQFNNYYNLGRQCRPIVYNNILCYKKPHARKSYDLQAAPDFEEANLPCFEFTVARI